MSVDGGDFPDHGAVAALVDKLQESAQGVEGDQYSRARVHFDVTLPHIGVDIGGRFPDYGGEDHFFAGLAFGDGLEVDMGVERASRGRDWMGARGRRYRRGVAGGAVPFGRGGIAELDFARVVGAPKQQLTVFPGWTFSTGKNCE